MRRSSDRILTTHVGSLPRPAGIVEVLRAEVGGQTYDEAELECALTPAVADVVRKQVDAGIDIPSDGEFGKASWVEYVIERLGGLARRDLPPGMTTWSTSKDRQDFAEFYAVYNPIAASMWIAPEAQAKLKDAPAVTPGRWVAAGPITFKGRHAIDRDIANFKAALSDAHVDEAFMPLAAPASIEAMFANEHYRSDEEYLTALADALREEYLAVVDAGLVLQVDDAFIPYNYERQLVEGRTMQEYLEHCQLRIEVVNYALRDIPEDRVRYHICWGSWAGPHTSDVPLKDIVHLLLKVKAQAYSVEAANPRHDWEWKVWEDVTLPEGKILIPGVITHSTNVVEHPETVAQRLERYASVVGKENVMAGSDCGFAQGWSSARTHPTVIWAKMAAMAEGARIASRHLAGAPLAVA